MGQFILFLLGLFAIGCVLYGIAAGVQIIQRGFSWLAKSGRSESAAHGEPTPAALPTTAPPAPPNSTPQPSAPEASPLHRSIDELRALFALYQQGALTQAEFEGIKRSLLTNIHSVAPHGR